MKRHIVSKQDVEEPVAKREDFYEAMPMAEHYHEPVVLQDENDRTTMSGWAVLGLVILGILVLMMLFGRGGIINPGVNRTNTLPTPSTNTTPTH